MILRKLLFISALSLGSLWVNAQNVVDDDDDIDGDSIDVETEIDLDDQAVRENPEIDGLDEEFDLVVPSFIKQKRNHIDFNGANWAGLRADIRRSDRVPFTIVHIGDSHLQADFATRMVRDNIQYDFGNAGRGIITPLKMSGTNEPRDYTFSSTQGWSAVKLMNQSWPRTMGFTGTSITPNNTSSNFLVSTSDRDDYNPFSSITVFHRGQFYVTAVTDEDGNKLSFVATPSTDYTHIRLTDDVTAARIYFDSAGDLTLFGASLSGNRSGVFYHVIGNNGAAYETYNRIGTMGKGISPLNPNLVIISLGTNEAFGNFDGRRFTDAMNRLIENIRLANPNATFLLVTPMECQRTSYTTVTVKTKAKGKGKKKKKARTVTKKVKGGYKINANVEKVRDAIVDYGKHNHIAVYDWYSIAGGEHASDKWIRDGLFSHDRVHHSYKGYQLQGYLLYKALSEALTE